MLAVWFLDDGDVIKVKAFSHGLCADEKALDGKFAVKGCDHVYCADCVRSYVSSKLDDDVYNVVESGASFGTGTSSRNSKYCFEHGVLYEQLGKLIVATRESEVPKLNEMLNRGTKNGVDGLRMIEVSEAKEMEPELHCVEALLSPASGIVEFGQLKRRRCITPRARPSAESYGELRSFAVVALAKQLIGIEDGVIPASFFARGCYFTLAKTKPPFQHVIYPIPEDGGLGVHVSLGLDGQIKFGPDVEWIG
ncbi:L-2-hydroxyglutarate dehydrogenase-like protein [Drosera capensis]